MTHENKRFLKFSTSFHISNIMKTKGDSSRLQMGSLCLPRLQAASPGSCT